MKKWKKLLLPAMCVFMLQTPVIANAEVAGRCSRKSGCSSHTCIIKWNY